MLHGVSEFLHSKAKRLFLNRARRSISPDVPWEAYSIWVAVGMPAAAQAAFSAVVTGSAELASSNRNRVACRALCVIELLATTAAGMRYCPATLRTGVRCRSKILSALCGLQTTSRMSSGCSVLQYVRMNVWASSSLR